MFLGKVRKWTKLLFMVFLLFLPLMLIRQLRGGETYQDAYQNWAAGKRYAHLSVFFSRMAQFDLDQVKKLRNEVDTALLADDAREGKNGTVSWTDCYSTKGSVVVDTGAAPVEVTAYGVGGHFFRFHSFRLVSGSYFSEENLMDDLIVIDEDLAWQLFGSADIVGMTVNVNGAPYQICGVIMRENGLFNKSAGNGKTAVYLSYSALEKNGVSEITDYEIFMPDLTKGYAKKIMKKNLTAFAGEYELSVVSGRFSYGRLFRQIGKMGVSAMHLKAIDYPFWENKQRAVQQICTVLFLLFLVESAGMVLYLGGMSACWYAGHRTDVKEKGRLIKETVKAKIKEVKGKQMNKKTDTVILDIGMVLAEFLPREYLKTVGIQEEKIEEVYKAVVDNDIWNEYDRGVMTEQEVLRNMINRSKSLEKEIRRAFHDLHGIVKRYDYTDAWIAELKEQGYRVLYLSNLSEKLYRECNEELTFVNDMDGGILSFEAKMIKPESEIYELLIKKYSLIPETCVFIDDREANVQAAQMLGFQTIRFEGVDAVRDRLKEILDKKKQ